MGNNIVILNWKNIFHEKSGGAEIYTYECARRWVENGHMVTWVAAGEQKETEIDGIKLVNVGSTYSVYREAKKWVQRQPKNSIDYLIDEVNTRPFGTPVWLAETHPDTHLLTLAHQIADEVWNYEMPIGLAQLGKYVLEPYWWKAYVNTPVAVPSVSTQKSLTKFNIHNTHLIAEGVRVPEYVQVKKNDVPTVVIPGRINRMKRTEDGIEAFLKSKEKIVNAECVVVGSGPDLEKLRAKYSDETSVVFTGHVDEETKWKQISSAHVLLACGVREGWGLVVSEGAAVGTYPIGYSAPGLIDSIDAAGGSLVENGNVSKLSEQLTEALKTYTKTSYAPVEYGGAHSWDYVAQNFWKTLISQSRKAKNCQKRHKHR